MYASSRENLSFSLGSLTQINLFKLPKLARISGVIVLSSGQIAINSNTIGCLPVCGDNPRALASGLSYVQVDIHGIIILYNLHQCRSYTS